MNLFGDNLTEFELLEDAEEQHSEYDRLQATSVLSFDAAAPMLLTKANISSFAEKFIESVTGGHEDPLKTAAIINGLETALKAIKEGIRPIVLDNLKEGGKGSFQGVKIETMEAGGKYDYTTCGDLVYNELKGESEKLDAKVKEREAFLKAAPKTGIDIVSSDGELYTIYPPAKPATTTTYKITIPK